MGLGYKLACNKVHVVSALRCHLMRAVAPDLASLAGKCLEEAASWAGPVHVIPKRYHLLEAVGDAGAMPELPNDHL